LKIRTDVTGQLLLVMTLRLSLLPLLLLDHTTLRCCWWWCCCCC
jgi:hypothetical protein